MRDDADPTEYWFIRWSWCSPRAALVCCCRPLLALCLIMVPSSSWPRWRREDGGAGAGGGGKTIDWRCIQYNKYRGIHI